jgi:hypothetical protein
MFPEINKYLAHNFPLILQLVRQQHKSFICLTITQIQKWCKNQLNRK